MYVRSVSACHALVTHNPLADVAQENIDPVRTHLWPDLYDSHPLFSRYFVGVVYNEAAKLCRLVVSKELQDAYPEDDAYAAEWLRNIN